MSEVLSYAALKESHDRLLAENVAMKGALTGEKYLDFIKQNKWNPAVKTVNGNFSCFMDPEVDFGSMVYSFAKGMIDTAATPATDAALAAMKKQAGIEAVELFAEHMLTLANDPTYATGSYRDDLRTAGAKANAYLTELREAK